MPDILVCGFEAFGSWEVNPTAVAVETLDGRDFHGYKVNGRVLQLRYKNIRQQLQEIVTLTKPMAIILSGQAGGSTIRLEQKAVNEAKTSTPYNCGSTPDGEMLDPEGSDVLHSTLPLESIYMALKLEKIPVTYSDDAGRFGCNQALYHTLHDHSSIPAGFIHVPLLPSQVKEGPSMDQERIIRALELITHITISSVK